MFDIKTINTGYIMADGGAMFGAIPKRAWSRKYIFNDENLCPLAMRCVLAISGDRKILIDLGLGNKHDSQISYYQPHGLTDITHSLYKHNISENDITDVVLTHLHFDHCGYATKLDENNNIVPTYPNAKYWLSQKQWDSFNTPNLIEKDSFFADNIKPVQEAGLLNFVDGEIELASGFRLETYDGHTSGQLVPIIKTQKGIIAIPGDLIPSSSHVALEWISAYDINALQSITEKMRFLEMAVKYDYTLIYYHDATVISSKVKRLNDNYKATGLIKEDYRPTQSRK